jgi:sulfonate transport system substrate-binding protein
VEYVARKSRSPTRCGFKPPTIQAVVGGSADFSFGVSATSALAAILAGSPLVFTLFAVVEPRTTAIIVKDGSGINSVSDLVGKTVAVNRSGLGEFILVAALGKYHVDRSRVKVVYLNPPEAAPAFGSGQVDAWAMWSPGVDLARSQYKGHDVCLEGRDLDFQIDFNSWLIRKEFAERNRDLVAAVNAAFATEAEWASAHSAEAETISQIQGHYDNAIRDMFISWKRQYQIHRADDQAFLAELQRAADWLSAREVLPDQVHVADHLAFVQSGGFQTADSSANLRRSCRSVPGTQFWGSGPIRRSVATEAKTRVGVAQIAISR